MLNDLIQGSYAGRTIHSRGGDCRYRIVLLLLAPIDHPDEIGRAHAVPCDSDGVYSLPAATFVVDYVVDGGRFVLANL